MFLTVTLAVCPPILKTKRLGFGTASCGSELSFDLRKTHVRRRGKARIARANRTAADLAPVIAELYAAGITSLNCIAAAFDERRIPTPAGSGHWHAAQIAWVLKRLAG
jgi:hypothetical protein